MRRFGMDMEKHDTIIQLIKQLHAVVDLEQAKIIDHWEADLCAIGLSKDLRSVYISTYSYCDLPVISYDFDLEVSTGDLLHEFAVVKEGRNVPETELINEIKTFLSV
jgi:hypothetical protein